jgi:hypothetical protein
VFARAPPSRAMRAPVSIRQKLAEWVRKLGVTDEELKPNHAWRHTFKSRADRAGTTERTSDYITGHPPKTVAATDGAPTVEDMAAALEKFTRYEIERGTGDIAYQLAPVHVARAASCWPSHSTILESPVLSCASMSKRSAIERLLMQRA